MSEILRNDRLFLNSLEVSKRSEIMSSHHDLPQGSVAFAGSDAHLTEAQRVRKSDSPVRELGEGSRAGAASSAVVPGVQSFPSLCAAMLAGGFQAQSRAPRVMGHSMKRLSPCTHLFGEEIHPSWKCPRRLSLGAHWSGQEHVPPTLIIAKEAGMTMAGFHPSRPIPRAQGLGAMELNTPAGEKKETASNSKAFHSIPGHDCWYPMRPWWAS